MDLFLLVGRDLREHIGPYIGLGCRSWGSNRSVDEAFSD
jgi:hypothetical protein